VRSRARRICTAVVVTGLDGIDGFSDFPDTAFTARELLRVEE
jgi:hypothetical protein